MRIRSSLAVFIVLSLGLSGQVLIRKPTSGGGGASTNGTNGQGLTSNGSGGFGTPVTLAPSATTDTTNAGNIGTGTLPHGRLPALQSADIPNSPSLGAGASPITETWTAGAGGVTAATLVQTDSSAPAKIVAATTGAYGIALSTVSAAGTVEVARYGTVNCIADTGGATAGDLVILGTGSPIDCKDAGITSSASIPIGARIIGVFRSSVTAGNPALVELTPAHFGTQLAGVCSITATSGAITLDHTCSNGTGASSGNTIFKIGPLTGSITLPAPSLKTGPFQLQIKNGASAQTVTVPSWLKNAATIPNLASATIVYDGQWDGTAATSPRAGVDTNGYCSTSPDSGVNPNSGFLETFCDSATGRFMTRDSSGNILGGVKDLASSSHQFLTQIVNGVPSKSQPGFTDISGTTALSQGGTNNTAPTTCSRLGDVYSPLVNALDSTDQLTGNGSNLYFSMNSGAPQLPSGFIVSGCHFTIRYMVDSTIGATNSNITITPVLCDTPTCGTNAYALSSSSAATNFGPTNTTAGLYFTVECVGTSAAGASVSILCGWNPPSGKNGGTVSSIVTITTNQILYPNLRYNQAAQTGNKMSMLYNATTVP